LKVLALRGALLDGTNWLGGPKLVCVSTDLGYNDRLTFHQLSNGPPCCSRGTTVASIYHLHYRLKRTVSLLGPYYGPGRGAGRTGIYSDPANGAHMAIPCIRNDPCAVMPECTTLLAADASGKARAESDILSGSKFGSDFHPRGKQQCLPASHGRICQLSP